MMSIHESHLPRRVRAGVAWRDPSYWLSRTATGATSPGVLVAAFSTRHGGVSDGGFAQMNLSLRVGDDPERVGENRGRLAASLDVPVDAIVAASQVHGAAIARVDRVPSNGAALAEADGLVTDQPGVYLRLLFADCVPILVADRVRRVVGIGHGGWRGTTLGVARSLIRTMIEAYHCAPSELRAVVGPSIGPCCYEVGPEVAAAFRQSWPDAEAYVHSPGGRLSVDLWEANRRQLVGAGLSPENILMSNICTRCHTDEFFSHRGQQGQAGRFAALIGLRG